MEKSLSVEQEKAIKDKVAEIKKTKSLRGKIYPIYVFGDTDCGEKELYVAYMGEPNRMSMSKFMSMVKNDEVKAVSALANDIFIEGDRDLLDNDSLFLYGLMGQISAIMGSRQSGIVGL